MKLGNIILTEGIYDGMDDLAKEICQYILEHYDLFKKKGLDLYSILKKYCSEHPSPDTKRMEERLSPFNERKNKQKRAVKIYSYGGELSTAAAMERAYNDCIHNGRSCSSARGRTGKAGPA